MREILKTPWKVDLEVNTIEVSSRSMTDNIKYISVVGEDGTEICMIDVETQVSKDDAISHARLIAVCPAMYTIIEHIATDGAELTPELILAAKQVIAKAEKGWKDGI